MWPFLKPDERLLVKPALTGQLKTGDIILYQDESLSPSKDGKHNLVCHRLIGKAKAGEGYNLLIRADNSCGPPTMIPETRLKGKVVGIVRNNRVIDLTGKGRYYLNRIILLIAPLASRLAKTAKIILRQTCKKLK